jgi:formylglycine-generating enzyme
MNRIFASLMAFSSMFTVAPLVASPITMAWSPVGNAGNAADPSTGFGAVDYTYNIGTSDVTVSQYVAFLNSNDPTGVDPLDLYNINMSSTQGGVSVNAGAASGNKYSVIAGTGNNRMNFVNFFDAMRFANWLDNGQAPGSTETGAYTLLGGTPTPTNANSVTRNAGATVFLPSENEWYKAAYYNPATSSYFQYPTSSNTAPNATGPTSAPNSANYNNAVGHQTAVGAYSGTTSPYGVFDMGGNVFQWNDTLFNDFTRGIRGGSDALPSSILLSSNRESEGPGTSGSFIGFRVASVPEPGTGALAVLAFGLICVLRKRCQ